MSWMLRALSVTLLGAVALSQTGCLLVAAAAATGGTVAYISGDLNTSVNAPPDKVEAATKAAMEKMKITVISSQSSTVDCRIIGRTGRDTKLTVVGKGSARSSQLSIRAGTFGDDAIQARLLEMINSELDALGAAPATQPMAGERN